MIIFQLFFGVQKLNSCCNHDHPRAPSITEPAAVTPRQVAVEPPTAWPGPAFPKGRVTGPHSSADGPPIRRFLGVTDGARCWLHDELEWCLNVANDGGFDGYNMYQYVIIHGYDGC